MGIEMPSLLLLGHSHYVASMLWSHVTDYAPVSYLLKKEMATHSSILSWEIPWTEEACGLSSMGFSRVGCDLIIKTPPPPLVYCPVSEKEEPRKDKLQLWRRGRNVCQGQFPISVTKLLTQIISNLKVQYWVF